MIKKEITLHDGSKHLVGFKEVEGWSGTKGIECHILKKSLFSNTSIYKKFYIKGIAPNYKQMALFTILDYQRENEQKQELLNSNWV